MFLVSITNHKLNLEFSANYSINILKESFSIFITIITDNFISNLSYQKNGFIIEEKIKQKEFNHYHIVMSRISYKRNKYQLEIEKNTLAGRTLYYYQDKMGNFFCSSHISLLRKVGVPIVENVDLIPEFLVYRYIIPPKTLYKDIYKLQVGNNLIYSIKQKKICIENDRLFQKTNKNINSIKKNIKKLSGTISRFIKSLIPYKDRYVLLLSGGLDSTLLFSYINKKILIKKTYSTGYPNLDNDDNLEKKYALSAAHFFKINHHYENISHNDYLIGLIESIKAAEEPIHHFQSVLLYLLFKKGIPENKDIIINGQGADGLFGTGIHYMIYLTEKYYHFLRLKPILYIIKKLSNYLNIGKKYFNYWLPKILQSYHLSINNPKHIIWKFQQYGDIEWISKKFHVNKKRIIENRYNSLKMYLDNSTYDILTILDLLGDISITQSIWSKLGESQKKVLIYPFTQENLLKNAFSIPWNQKLKKPKNILRKMASYNKLPKFIINRKKLGFGTDSKDIIDILNPILPLCNKTFEKFNIDKDEIKDPKMDMIIWNLINYTIWKKLFIDGESLDVVNIENNETDDEFSKQRINY